AVIESLVRTTREAAAGAGLTRVALVGGVACNGALRDAMRERFGKNVFFPSPSLCTDNAAMIAKAGLEHYRRGRVRFPSMQPSPALKKAG
ncbi:MAG: tRNA (adenosine(37)-N6)-threonylcarbamoyltransferase complex transferase subunit TsaD, partial [Chitinivibrionales bacterium]|nr:tRNA (adenosine(37)-N6)-threonylcarbamoyltransferase complex transferase subunit TsaD [Chitinivibrionales bacterium]MBD3396651.1 tRNA (adenosine(37)-N6)-threonylcarbamoyltransferase complex transferase subunit TsaD [Chitinivibrionales bacterium]